MANTGKLIVITGPMFAGKTTKLLSEIQKAHKSKKKVILFKSAIDNRYSDVDVVSHNGARFPAVTLPDGAEGIKALYEAAENYDVIGIDEGHFWDDTKGLADTLNKLAFKSKSIYVAMLNRKSDGTSFNLSKELLPFADHVQFINAKCARCAKDATFTQRVTPYRTVNGEISYVGGKEDYEARCRNCFTPPPKA